MKPEFQEAIAFIGENIVRYRKARNWTVRDLAVALDSCETYIKNIEKGLTDPPFTLVCHIAKVLRVKVEKLAEGFKHRLKRKVQIPGVGLRHVCYEGTPDVPNDASPADRAEAAKRWYERQGDQYC